MDGIPFVNAVDVVFEESLENEAHKNVGRTCGAWWKRAGAASCHAHKDGGALGTFGRGHLPLNLFGQPIPMSQCWDPHCKSMIGTQTLDRRAIRSPWISLDDAAALRCSFTVDADALPQAPPGAMVYLPLDCVQHSTALVDSIDEVSPPQIWALDKGIVRKTPIALAMRLHETSPDNNCWFEIPARVVEGGSTEDFFTSFPFSLKSDGAEVLDVTQFYEGAAGAEHTTVKYVVPLSSIEECDQAKATFFHEYFGMSLMGQPLAGEAMTSAATLSYQEKYDSAMWVSSAMMERHGLIPKCEEVLGFSTCFKDGFNATMVNADLLEAVPNAQWERIARELFAGSRRYRLGRE